MHTKTAAIGSPSSSGTPFAQRMDWSPDHRDVKATAITAASVAEVGYGVNKFSESCKCLVSNDMQPMTFI
jgi:hypothetical protein